MSKASDSSNTGGQVDVDEQSPDMLLVDLESIRELLDVELPVDEEATAESRVPLLDDVVDGGIDLQETSFERPALDLDTGMDATEDSLDEDLFQALLGDDWQRTAADLMTEARGAIEAQRNEWTPEHTDELNEALRIRIDATLTEWLHKTIRAHLQELRAEILSAAEAALNEQIKALLEARPPLNERGDSDTDG